jgi:hypothetical protein
VFSAIFGKFFSTLPSFGFKHQTCSNKLNFHRPETRNKTLQKPMAGPCLFHHGFCGLWALSLFTMFSIYDEFRSLTGCLKEVRWRGPTWIG